MSNTTQTKVYPAGPPLEGQWVLEWQTPVMPAPAFWYFDTEEAARAAESRMLEGTTTEAEHASQRPPTYRTLITAACYPEASDTAEEYVQATTVLVHRCLEMLVTMHTIIGAEAPILLQRSSFGMAIAVLGQTLQDLERRSLDWMTEHDVEALNLRAEEKRVAQIELDTATDMPEGMRAELQKIVDEPDPDAEGEQWPEIVLPDSGQVN